MQVSMLREGRIPVCHESNEISYGNLLVVFVNSWPHEDFHAIDLCIPMTDKMEMSLPTHFCFC